MKSAWARRSIDDDGCADDDWMMLMGLNETLSLSLHLTSRCIFLSLNPANRSQLRRGLDANIGCIDPQCSLAWDRKYWQNPGWIAEREIPTLDWKLNDLGGIFEVCHHFF